MSYHSSVALASDYRTRLVASGHQGCERMLVLKTTLPELSGHQIVLANRHHVSSDHPTIEKSHVLISHLIIHDF